MGALERYRRVLGAPHVGALWVAVTIARLPIGINGLAIILAVRHETGSYGTAGAAAGAYALTLGLGSPIQGRLMDRLTPRRVLPPLVAFSSAVLVAFVALLGHTDPAVLVVLAGVAGLGLPPWSSLLRAMWPRLLGDDALVTTAFALDATIVELVFIIGPLLVAVAVAVASPQAALLASAGLVLVGTAMILSSPAVHAWETEARPGRNPFGALGGRGMRTIVFATIPIGFGFGAMEIGLPAFATAHHAQGDAGLLIAVWSLGSAAGGLLYGARTATRSLAERWLICAAAMGATFLLPLAAPSIGVLLAVLVPAGVFIAPTLASSSQLTGTLAPPGMTAEAYAWGQTSIVIGASAGSALAGGLAESSGWRAAVALAGGAALVGFAIALARRRTLA